MRNKSHSEVESRIRELYERSCMEPLTAVGSAVCAHGAQIRDARYVKEPSPGIEDLSCEHSLKSWFFYRGVDGIISDTQSDDFNTLHKKSRSVVAISSEGKYYSSIGLDKFQPPLYLTAKQATIELVGCPSVKTADRTGNTRFITQSSLGLTDAVICVHSIDLGEVEDYKTHPLDRETRKGENQREGLRYGTICAALGGAAGMFLLPMVAVPLYAGACALVGGGARYSHWNQCDIKQLREVLNSASGNLNISFYGHLNR